MTRGECIKYMRYKLDVINSNISPSYEDSELYPFLDRATVLIIKDFIKSGNLEPIKDVIATELFSAASLSHANNSSGFVSNHESQFPVYADLSNLNGGDNTFLDYIDGSILLYRPNDTVNQITFENSTWVKLDKKERIIANRYKTSNFNKPYFLNPVAYISDNTKHLVIIPDYWTQFDKLELASGSMLHLTYAKMPTKFEDIADDDTEPDLSPDLHYNIVDTASDFAKIPIDPQSAAAEVQVDNAVKEKSEKEQ